MILTLMQVNITYM